MNTFSILITTRTHVSSRENKEANLFRKDDGRFQVFSIAIVKVTHDTTTTMLFIYSHCIHFINSLYILTCSGSRGPWSMCYASHDVLLCSGSRHNAIFSLRHGQGKKYVHW